MRSCLRSTAHENFRLWALRAWHLRGRGNARRVRRWGPVTTSAVGLVSAEHCAVATRPTARGPGNCGYERRRADQRGDGHCTDRLCRHSGGGPVYKHIPKNIKELKNSGFNELIVWSVEVGSTGDLNLNGEFPLTSAGDYIGNETYPDFPADLKKIKRGKVTRVTLSIGSSNYGDWENIKALVDSQGTGQDSILYKDFAALKAALPLDAIDFDDENSYDASSTIKFAVMLGKLGYKVTMNPYTNSGYWTGVVSTNQQQAGRHGGWHSFADLCRRQRQQSLLGAGISAACRFIPAYRTNPRRRPI